MARAIFLAKICFGIIACTLLISPISIGSVSLDAKADAQVNCPEGYWAVPNPGANPPWGCQPINQPPEARIPTHEPSYEYREAPSYDPGPGGWGTIVAGGDNKVYTDWSAPSKSFATGRATAKCEQAADVRNVSDSCTLIATSDGINIALAFDGTHYHVGQAPEFRNGVAKALKACRKGKKGDVSKCHIALLFNPKDGPLSEEDAKPFLER